MISKTAPSTIHDALQVPSTTQPLQLQGWIKSRRIGKNMTFIMLQDGSTQQPLQVVAQTSSLPEELVKELHIGSSLEVKGRLIQSQGAQQSYELQADEIKLIGVAPPDYPLQPKPHSLEFLRTIQHFRFRTHLFRAIFKVRHVAAYAIHTFFHQRGFSWIHTPIITDVDTEGAGETFEVVAHKGKEESPFFGNATHLTVSGQLALEAATFGMGKVYTFGPTFRAENSNTTRHLAEFWMIEPEMPFYDLAETITLAQDFLKGILQEVRNQCPQELDFLTQYQAKQQRDLPQEARLPATLDQVQNSRFQQITYTDALALLQGAAQKNPKCFTYPVAPWGIDLQKEHENYLTQHLGGALIITDYPKALKPFYMRQNEDGTTVAAMDMLLPRIGEIIGGSQREERYALLREAMKKQGLDQEKMNWYLDTRRFGSVPHSGFGLGFERLLQWLTGMENIREVIPYPRTPGHIQY